MADNNYEVFEYVTKPLGFFWKRTVSFSEKHSWIVVPLVVLVTYFFFWHILADIRIVLWRQMLKDYLLIIGLPLYLTIFFGTMNDIYEYSLYQSLHLENDINGFGKDVHLSIWEETRYYSLLGQEKLQHCDFGRDETELLKELRKYAGTEKEANPEAE